MSYNFKNVFALGVNLIIDMHEKGGYTTEEIVDMITEIIPEETQKELEAVMSTIADEDAEQEGTEA